MQKKVCVMVAGSWGSALANVLSNNGHQVWLWSRNQKQVDEINENHTNVKYLQDVKLSSDLIATTNVKEAAEHADAILLAAPTAAMREIAALIRPWVESQTVIIHAAKGFETGSLQRMSEVIADELKGLKTVKDIVALSGPSHAEEVIRQCPTTVVASSSSEQAAAFAQKLFNNQRFRVYSNPDLVGVETAGALKNIIAICGGLCDGLHLGDNAKAALITRGLAEMGRLGTAMGASPLTFNGLAGVGDLIVTCTSRHSRNWRAGYGIAQGKTLDQVLDEMGMVAEGVKATEAAVKLSLRYHVEMPITNELYRVMFENKHPRQAVSDLMNREQTHE